MSGRVLDVSHLPRYAFGHRSILWWGTLGFVATEGTVFVLAWMAYLYLRAKAPEWPPNLPPPTLLWGSLNAAILVASAVPNYFAKRAAEAEVKLWTVVWMVVTLVFAFGSVAIRWVEFEAMNVRWDTNAYGSIVWVLLGYHTVHLLTDLGDTVVLAALLVTRHGRGKRFVDASENAAYWYFVVLTWLVTYFIVYWLPRIGS